MPLKNDLHWSKKLLLYLPGLLIFLPLCFTRPDLVLFPNTKNYKLVTYTDKNDSLNKTFADAKYTKDTSITFNFTLSDVDSIPSDPFAGFAIELCKKAPFVDISKYDFFELDITLQHSNSFIVNFKTFIEGFTNINDWHTYHTETIQIPVHFGSTHYKIPLKDLRIPEWWWKVLGSVASTLPKKADREKLFGIDFQNGSGSPKNIEDQMVIRQIRFSKDLTLLYSILSGCFLLYMVSIYVTLRILKRKRSASSNADCSYQKLDINNHSTEESARITDYLGKNFQNPDITIELVSRDVGISASRISLVLQRACNLTFKQYLNEIRITEAKRLLKETDRTITEIGFAVGYNNITHFNRVSKTVLDNRHLIIEITFCLLNDKNYPDRTI